MNMAEVLPDDGGNRGHFAQQRESAGNQGNVEQLRQLREWRWDQADLLVLYIDGQRFGRIT